MLLWHLFLIIIINNNNNPLICPHRPNLVCIGCVLPDLFRKDWFFSPKSHYNYRLSAYNHTNVILYRQQNNIRYSKVESSNLVNFVIHSNVTKRATQLSRVTPTFVLLFHLSITCLTFTITSWFTNFVTCRARPVGRFDTTPNNCHTLVRLPFADHRPGYNSLQCF